MSAERMTLTILATELAQAVANDETPEAGGCDLHAGVFGPHVSAWLRDLASKLVDAPKRTTPIDMVLYCPRCHLQHVDAPSWKYRHWPKEPIPDNTGEWRVSATEVKPRGDIAEIVEWKNDPHRSHLCVGCGHIWRPADVPTNGVAAAQTKGKEDSPRVGL